MQRKALDEFGGSRSLTVATVGRRNAEGQALCEYDECPDLGTLAGMGSRKRPDGSPEGGPWYCADHYTAWIEHGDRPLSNQILHAKMNRDMRLRSDERGRRTPAMTMVDDRIALAKSGSPEQWAQAIRASTGPMSAEDRRDVLDFLRQTIRSATTLPYDKQKKHDE